MPEVHFAFAPHFLASCPGCDISEVRTANAAAAAAAAAAAQTDDWIETPNANLYPEEGSDDTDDVVTTVPADDASLRGDDDGDENDNDDDDGEDDDEDGGEGKDEDNDEDNGESDNDADACAI